jgi:hypothetical protein
MYFLSYIQGMCTQCSKKAKVKTTDEHDNPTSYYTLCQEHKDDQQANKKATYKDCKARVSYRFYLHIVLVII